MNIRKTFAGLVAIAGLTTLVAASANAQLSFTTGTAGGFTLITDNGLGVTSPVSINFGAPANDTPADSVAGISAQGLSGRGFTITQGSKTLLSGTFGTSNSSGTTASGGIQLFSNSVTYTGGADLGAAKSSADSGSLAITFNNSGPLVASSTQVDDFIGDDAITVGRVPLGTTPAGAPEPASLAGVGIGVLFVLCLGLCGKRRATARPV